MRTPRLVVAGVASGVGKTTVSLLLMASLKARGYKVGGFKVGPDYIDPSHHSAILGRPSRNLDLWLLPSRRLKEAFARGCEGIDIAVIEGVMGLFDGLDAWSDRMSTAHVARLLRAPVVLVVDASGVGRSVAAMVKGYLRVGRGSKLVGVILNRVGSEGHAKLCEEGLRGIGVRVLGSIPQEEGLKLEERHLGLVPSRERPPSQSFLEALRRVGEEHLKLEDLVQLASEAGELKVNPGPPSRESSQEEGIRLGLALDEAFNFYYEDGLELLRASGARIIPFSPLHDSKPPSVDALYVGGGFPEVLPGPLEANESMREGMRRWVLEGRPLYAECGGLMYLCKALVDGEGRRYSMVGALEAEVVMSERLTLGYTEAEVVKENLLAARGSRLRGHEFHYSQLVGVPRDAEMAYRLRRGLGIVEGRDGWVRYGLLASYMHLNLAASPKMIRRFLRYIRRSSRR